ncbi:hypothetical protein [Thermoanaerobacterium sp. DL9XJH110]|uniref:hypothetical protein n=1 Tax=Thermoanaerobacterium sp. DL9XJH110 TaxID=3386643 RepID=UPI003BB76DDA
MADICQKLKTLVVVCEQNVQEIGEIRITAPPGVILDPITGLLNVKPTLTVVDNPVLNDATLDGKVINYGWVKVLLTITGIAVPVSSYYAIPLQGHISCPDIQPGDHVQHFPKLEGTLVYALPSVDPVTGSLSTGVLSLKVAYDVKIVVAREQLVSVPVCPPKVNQFQSQLNNK